MTAPWNLEELKDHITREIDIDQKNCNTRLFEFNEAMSDL